MDGAGLVLLNLFLMYFVTRAAVNHGTSTPQAERHLIAQTELLRRIALQQGVPASELDEIMEATRRPPSPPRLGPSTTSTEIAQR